MAECVERHREAMLPLYEALKNQNLVNGDDLSKIIKTQLDFEYKINKPTKELNDFIEYIAFERHLVKRCHEKEKPAISRETGAKTFGAAVTILADHIKFLFRQSIQLFPNDVKLWDNFMKFCQAFNFYVDASNAIENMLQFHSHHPVMWLAAINHEYKYMGNMKKVKDLLMRAVQRNPEHEKLHIEFIKYLLSEIKKYEKITMDDNTQKAKKESILNQIEVIYNSSRKRICKVEYLINVLKLLENYPFTKRLQKIVITDMLGAFQRNELTWHILALRELKGLNTKDILNDNNTSELITTELIEAMGKKYFYEDEKNTIAQTLSKSTLNKRINICSFVYKTGAQTLGTKLMWKLYINTMVELNYDKTILKSVKEQKLAEAYKGAVEAGLMSEDHYVSYVKLLKDSKQEVEKFEMIMKKAIQDYPHSVPIWELWMQHYIDENNNDKIYEIFRKATKKLASESFPLWGLLIRYYLTRNDYRDKLDQIYKEAVQFTSYDFLSFRVQYLEWIYLNYPIKRTRSVYDEMTNLSPPCYKLHTHMTFLESSQLKPSFPRWRKCYENLVAFFGRDKIEVWIDYLRFEKKNNPDNMKVLSDLYSRAKGTLHNDLWNEFLTQHSFFMTGLMD